MKELKMTHEQSMVDYPKPMGEMLGDLIVSNPNAKLENVDIYYYWTILPLSDYKMDEYKHLLLYDERLQYELDKVVVEIYIRHGSYIRGEDVSDHIKPNIISDELSKIVVTSMLYEQMVYNNKEVIDSIPLDVSEIDIDLKNSLIPIIKQKTDHNINSDLDLDIHLDEVFTLDEILEKISTHGIENLTLSEIERLNELSKD